jgi:hypothetical protein
MILQEYLNPVAAKSKVTLEEGTDSFGNKAKKLYMEGIFIQGDIRNANERIYPVKEIQRAVNTINEQLEKGISICGEVDHPDDLKINLDRVSHCIVKMGMEGSNGVGKLQILPTPMGQLVTTMLESGVKLGVSSRGSGNVNDYDGTVSDFEIITIDIVAQPSAPNAYPKAIYESLMNMKYGHKVLEIAKEVQGNSRVQRFLGEEVKRLIRELRI